MYHILHQHYESVLRLTKILNPEKLDKFYCLYESDRFLKLKPQQRLKLIQSSLPIPNSEHFTLVNFVKIAHHTVSEMVTYNISHIELRVSLHLERWQGVSDIAHAKFVYDQVISNYPNKSISFIGAVDFAKTDESIERSINALSQKHVLDSIVGVDITMYEDDIKKFNKYYTSLLAIRSIHNKKINIHLGEFTNNEINREVLTKLKPNRIGHGIALLDSSDLCEIIKDNDICIDICPVSNQILGVVDWNIYNPIKQALRQNIPVTINTDDPITFNSNIEQDIKLANLTPQEFKKVIENSKKYAD